MSLGYIQVPALGPGSSWFDVARAGTPTRIWGTDPRLPGRYAVGPYRARGNWGVLGVVTPGMRPEHAEEHEDVGAALLAISILIGGAVIGKAAIDHAFDARRSRRSPSEFEKQHYGAVGLGRSRDPSRVKDFVAYGVAIAATAWLLKTGAEVLTNGGD